MNEDARARLTALFASTRAPVPFDKIDTATLPIMVCGPDPQRAAPNGDALERNGKLTTLVDKSLDILDECLDADDVDQNEIRLLSLKKEVALGVIGMQVKVDDTSLRRHQIDMMPRILQLLAQARERLPVIEIDAVVE